MINSKPDRGVPITEDKIPSNAYQAFFDDLETQFSDVIQLTPYTVATVPPATDNEDALIRVTDESTGAMIAISDGVDWRTAAGVIIS